jgi:Fe-Mn family superoxide dismutase
MSMTRRESLSALSVGMLVASAGEVMAEPEKTAPQLPPGKHPLVPLPFNPKKLKGLSEKLLVSHHENNYGGAVKNLNKVEEELARVTQETPGFAIAGLKERELTFTNSLILHEHYFGNLGGDGKPAGAIQKAIDGAFGGFARWEEQFRATGMGLAGGSGWVILDYNFHSGDLRTYWSGNHTQSVAFGQPLLVMDMYEHAYQMDFGAAAAKYLDAFMANVRWDEVDRRFERARKAAAALRAT